MPISPGKKQGYKAQIAISTTTNTGAVVCATLKELDWEIKAAALDATDHSTNGWESKIPGLLSWSGTAKLDFFEGDAEIIMLRTAILNSTTIYVNMYHEMTAAGSGEEVYQGQAIITSCKLDGKNNDLQGVDISLEGTGALVLSVQ